MRGLKFAWSMVVPLGVVFSAASMSAAPTTEPAGNETAALVLPFAAPAGANYQWVGKAVQQDLLTDLAQGTKMRVLAPADAPPAADAEAARRAASNLGLSIVVFGQVQTAGSETRLTGQVLDVASGRPLANLKATGPSDGLFHLEDALAGQTLAAVPQAMLNPQALEAQRQAAAQQHAPSATSQAPAQSGYAPQQPTSGYSPSTGAAGDNYVSAPQGYTYPAPAPAYSYYEPVAYAYPVPAYTYAYPAWNLWPFWGSFVFIGDFDFDFDRDHHHDFDRDHGFDRDHRFDRGGGFDRGQRFNGRGTGQPARSGAGNFAPRGSAGFHRGTMMPSSGFRGGALAHGGMGGFRSSPSFGGMRGGVRGGFGGAGFGGGGFHGGAGHAGGGHR